MDGLLHEELPLGAIESTVIQRPICLVCARPKSVCVCHAICDKIPVNTTVIILQHPAEQNRQLRTVPLLKAGLQDEKCLVYVGKKFTNLPELKLPSTALLFPGNDAIDCEELSPGAYKQLVCLDGTWPQAKRIYSKSPILQSLPKVMLKGTRKSVYLIHTQPTALHLSTLESVARALQGMERLDGLEEKLIAPLKEMVRLQFGFGALAHGTQEEARIMRKQEIKNGLKEHNLTVAPKLETFDYDSF